MNRKNVTFIDDLFDADNGIPGPNGMPSSQNDYMMKGNAERDEFRNQIQSKHIRSNDRDYAYALNGGAENIQHQPQYQHHPQHPQPPQPLYENYNQRSFFPFELDTFQQPRYNIQQQQFQPVQEKYIEEISCMTVANHIKDCPICSKFYNSDNSMYIVCIALLIIVCIILLKRIIEKS
jgi:hypothetical protein